MAAPTASTMNEVLVANGTGTGTTLDTNVASRQIVRIYNNSPNVLWVIHGTGGTVTLGVGTPIYPGSSEWWWAGPGLRFQGRHDGTATMVTGAAAVVFEDV